MKKIGTIAFVIFLSVNAFAGTTKVEVQKDNAFIVVNGLSFERCNDGRVAVSIVDFVKEYPKYDWVKTGSCENAGTFRKFLQENPKKSISLVDDATTLNIDFTRITFFNDVLMNEFIDGITDLLSNYGSGDIVNIARCDRGKEIGTCLHVRSKNIVNTVRFLGK
jgi:hypothetical protein